MRYEVHSAFAHEGTFYTADNADEIPSLPVKVREHHEKLGHIFRVPASAPKTATSDKE